MGPRATPRAKFLTTAEAAVILEVHPDSLARWADDGKVPHWVTPGGQRRFRPEDIEALTAPVTPVDDEPAAI